MYTEGDEVPLMRVFQNISDARQGGLSGLAHKSATSAELASFMAEVLPDYDRDRVRDSDIRKLIQWYDILAAAGYTRFVDETSGEPEADGGAAAAESAQEPAAAPAGQE